MAEKYNLEIEYDVEWMLHRPDVGYQDKHKGRRLFDIGIDEDFYKEWKEHLGELWDKPIDLTVYFEDKPVFDPKERGFTPKSTFATTIGGAFDYLMANREAFGFAPKK
jgi:hypothetical protein